VSRCHHALSPHTNGRWLFIIDAIITLPIAVAGFFLYPNLPLQGKKTWWLTDEEFQLSRDRLNNIGRAGKTPWSWAKVRRLASSWHTWILRESRRGFITPLNAF
jgi:hypothetical protein